MIHLLSASEESLGRALTEKEVIHIAHAMAASRIKSHTLQASWENCDFVDEIEPDCAWQEWQIARLKLMKN
ncbi:hypothetical protein JIN85_00340 [Luteolibacter pohnpeiensis]|uniref:Uncharacterized protein n=1 Tax=Luteolibacter pohnpeiensis TaxID=454153 RepID=A0A934VSV9_9BACT|nr:hypothetical protein [Luteolibacter pohnpeiensis]MBK1880837.1 hypothetical protein [Luteolibacter pohnpeiensis]